MAPSVEGPPIISARALRWSDEEVSLVRLFCLLHFIYFKWSSSSCSLCVFMMCRSGGGRRGSTICVPQPDDTPLESSGRNNLSCIRYPISCYTLTHHNLTSHSLCDRISCDSIPPRAFSLVPRLCSCFKIHR